MPKILILGGTYFIGRHIARHLVDCGHDVTLLNRGTRMATLPTLFADRNDPRAMRAALAGRSFELVIDTSCYDATQALIAEGALTGRYQRWMFLSSAAVYADHATRPLHERSALVGSAGFGHGKRKLDAEKVLNELCWDRLTVLRPGYVYGPGNNLARETFIWARLLCGEDIYLPGEGKTRVSLIHVHDLARAVQALIEVQSLTARTFNLAHPDALSLREWVLSLAKHSGTNARLHAVPTEGLGIDARQFFPFRDLDLSLDVSSLRLQTGFVPRYDLESGLADTFASYQREDLVNMLRRSSVELELDAALSLTGDAEAFSTSPRPSSAS